MKCEAPSDKAGECSKCGMNLKKVDVNNHEHKSMHGDKMIDKNNDGVVYECPMKCEVPSDKAGSCSKCGMTLKKRAVKDMGNSTMSNHVVHKGTIDVSKIDKNKDGKVYQDMMDWNVISDKAGDCPLCGMTLKEVSVDQAKKNLEKNGFKTK